MREHYLTIGHPSAKYKALQEAPRSGGRKKQAHLGVVVTSEVTQPKRAFDYETSEVPLAMAAVDRTHRLPQRPVFSAVSGCAPRRAATGCTARYPEKVPAGTTEDKRSNAPVARAGNSRPTKTHGKYHLEHLRERSRRGLTRPSVAWADVLQR